MPLLPGIFASSGGATSTVSGGVVYSDSSYYYSVFLGGTTTFTVGIAPLNVDLIVIGGGGGAGTAAGGGGGAGGVVIRSGMLTTGSYTAVVGTGGAGAASDGGIGVSGVNSTFDTITAFGGGGGHHGGDGLTGGSGGGSGYGATAVFGAATQTSNGGGTGYGFNGGSSTGRTGSGSPYPCGGGGGAGGVGGSVSGTTGGPGGIGITNALINAIAAATGIGELSGGNYYLAGGGGGSRDSALVAGGLGGGGKGGTVVTANANVATDGLDNYGAGGGGGDVDPGGYPPVRAGRGGDGLIVVRYAKGDVVAPTSSYTTSGLLFNYDASNTASYPGSGTTFTDIVGARNLSMSNITYSSSNGGGLVFNGVNAFATGVLGNLGGTYTIEIALKYTAWNPSGNDALALTSSAADNHGLLIETNYAGSTSSGTNTIRYLHRMPYGGGGADDNLNSSTPVNLNTNYVITIVRIQGQRQNIYINGVKALADFYPTNSAFDSGLNRLTLGRITPNSDARQMNGTIYSVRGYTRALPEPEIKANFNAIKTRLGL